MANVNPPPQIKLPKKFQQDRDARIYFDHLSRVILQLWDRTGGSSDLINEAATNFNTSSASAIFDIYSRIGSGIPVTIDTTGFTIDNTKQTTDKTEV